MESPAYVKSQKGSLKDYDEYFNLTITTRFEFFFQVEEHKLFRYFSLTQKITRKVEQRYYAKVLKINTCANIPQKFNYFFIVSFFKLYQLKNRRKKIINC